MVRLGVLLSGTGRSLENLIRRIGRGNIPARIVKVVSSDPDARGLVIARDNNIPSEAISRSDHAEIGTFSEAITASLKEARVDLVCMAGFIHLYRIPEELEGKVLNIHPALVPSFSGSGFYGDQVHRAVLKKGVKVSGCTVHFADNEYDHGPIILQRTVPVEEGDTPETLAARVFEEECEAYPDAIRLFAERRLRIQDGRVEVLPAR
ncbi:MAG: phosphoribosylglycinamide formyltransferase [Planctomycetota bacterium]|nr:phosphoribosylglycinamide formyltransferase [Planctomycetota bacterium]